MEGNVNFLVWYNTTDKSLRDSFMVWGMCKLINVR